MGTEGGGRYIYGVNPVLEALRAHASEIERLFIADGDLGKGAAGEIFSRAKELGLRIQRVPREKLSSLAEGGVHQGVVAELRQFSYRELDELIAHAKGFPQPLLVLLDGIQDPHNFGAIIRSAHAFGAHGVVFSKDRSSQVTGAVAKSSAGAVEHTPIARVTNLSRALEELKEAGFWTAVLDLKGDKSPWEVAWNGPMAVVIGGEGSGVRPGVLKHCDFQVRIPLEGKVSSLNASVAAAVVLYEIARSRGAASAKRDP